MDFKVGDKFVLPHSPTFTGVYTVIRIEETEDALRPFIKVKYWAYFPENGGELWSDSTYMKRTTKLELALK